MTQQTISSLLRSLRETAPKLNKTTDDATKAIRYVESFLTSLSLGIPAEATVHVEHKTEVDDDGHPVKYQRYLTLAYAKHGNAFRLLLVQSNVFDTPDGEGISEQTLSTTPLAEAGRHDKLRAVAVLPDLIAQMVEDANKIQADAAKAVGTVNDIVTALPPEAQTQANPVGAAMFKKIAELEKPNPTK